VSAVRAVALVDGEHYPDVVRQALAALPYEWIGAILVGGTEKLREPPEYGVPLVTGFEGADIVVDLSDEPVLGPEERLRWASRALAEGLPYVGADFRFDPPDLEPFELPSVSVVGTGKRVGKTAVTGHLARLLARDRSVVVVAMGRGGPAEPEVVTSPPTVAELVARSRAGDHAASDHLETAATCGVTTIGCRRAGGGLAGAVFMSNVPAGARLAAGRGPDLVVFDGSGAAIPPVATDRRILVVGPGQHVDAYLNTYRRLISDLVIAVNCEADGAIPVTLRLRPSEPLSGRVAVFTAGGSDVSHLEADVVSVSTNLADRVVLGRELASLDADTYLVEVKAAAIDVVAEHALAQGRRIVLASNDVVSSGADLDAALLELVPQKVGAR
jgi:cyclic 2,3-diphosphoglycerate synthetase